MTHLQHPQLTLTPFALLENTTDSDMSNSSITTNPSMIDSSDNNQTDLIAPELSELMGDPEMVEHLCAAFSEDLISMMLVQYYQYCITLAVDVLNRHYEERNNLFCYAI